MVEKVRRKSAKPAPDGIGKTQVLRIDPGARTSERMYAQIVHRVLWRKRWSLGIRGFLACLASL